MTNEEALNSLKIECDNCIKVCEYCHIKVAIDAIEKQIRKCPSKRTRKTGIKVYYCPNCKWEVAENKFYCWNCGQSLDWGG